MKALRILLYQAFLGGFNIHVNGKYLVQRFYLTISKALVYLNLLYVVMSVIFILATIYVL